MIRKWKAVWKRAGCLALMVLSMCMLTACGEKMTPEKLMESMSTNMSGITSFANKVKLNFELEDVLYTTSVSMDISLESTSDPKAGHALGKAHIKMRGAELESVLEVYQVMEDGRRATYSSLDGNWSKEISEHTKGSVITIDNSLFSTMSDSVEDFEIADSMIEVNGEECYQMYGEVTGENLKAARRERGLGAGDPHYLQYIQGEAAPGADRG